MRFFLILISFLSLLVFHQSCFAQEEMKTITVDSVVKKTTDKFFLRAFPVIYLRPETGWGGGLAGTMTFNLNGRNEKTPASQISWAMSYTERKQFVLLLPFNLYFKNRKYYSEGEIDITNFSWEFWGIGNKNLLKESEKFYDNYKRLIFNVMTKLHDKIFGGLKFEVNDFPEQRIQPGGILDTHPEIFGRFGGIYKGIGTEFIYDTRDNIYSAKKGGMVDVTYLYWNKILFGDADFHRIFIDAQKFKSINKRWVVATDLNLQMNNGKEVPFTELSQLGGVTIMRGYYEGHYREKFLAGVAERHQQMLLLDPWQVLACGRNVACH